MPREASWISVLFSLSVFTVAVGVGGFLLWTWLSTMRTQRQRANAERYRAHYAGLLPLLYRYFAPYSARPAHLEPATNALARYITQFLVEHRDELGAHTFRTGGR